jgi:tRNA dimethylallyltransferase
MTCSWGQGREAASVDPEWEDFLAANGPQALWEELNKKDPEAAKKIPVANSRRSLRALSVISRTGGLFSKQQAEIKPAMTT